MICECKAAIADFAKFCPKCGKRVAESAHSSESSESLSDAKKCPQCGAENPATAKFCKKDGAPLAAAFSNRPAEPALPTPRTRTSIPLALVGGVVALLITSAGLGFFYFSRGGDQSPAAQTVSAGSGEKGVIDTKLAESNQTIKGLAQPLPESRPQSGSQPSLPPQPDATATASKAPPEPRLEPEPQPGLATRPDSANSSLPPLQESRAPSEPQPPLRSGPVTSPSPPPSESRPRSEPQPASESTSQLAGRSPQPIPDSPTASEAQPPPEGPEKLANAAPQLPEPPAPVAEPFPAQPTPEAPLPPLESVPQASPLPAAPDPAKLKAPAAAKSQKSAPPAVTSSGLNSALQQRGFNDVRAKVIDKQTVVLSGTASSAEDKASAGEFVSSASGMKNIRNEVRVAAARSAQSSPPKPDAAPKREGPTIEQVAIAKPDAAPDPAKLEGELNRALREEGVGGVTAQINSDLSATLRGAARSLTEKRTAYRIARQFPPIRDIKDQIFVVEE